MSSPHELSPPVFVIAEAGVNHGGDVERAIELVDAAAEAGADAVKFQTFRAGSLVTTTAAKAEYQIRTTGASESQHAMLRRLELADDDHHALARHCERRGIEFMSSPFDLRSLEFLVGDCAVHRIKLGSGELTHGQLLLCAARTGRPLIVSTGMARMREIEEMLSLLAFGMLEPHADPTPGRCAEAFGSAAGAACLQETVTLLHCNTAYPTPEADVNLRAMRTIGEAFEVPVGYSDHTMGIAVPVAAVATGATVIEKHLTLDRTSPGPDHRASLEPDAFGEMVAMIRAVSLAMGRPEKIVTPSEQPQRDVARRSLVASRPIRAGERFGPENLTSKRPGTGVSPMCFWAIVGTAATRDYAADEAIESSQTGSAAA